MLLPPLAARALVFDMLRRHYRRSLAWPELLFFNRYLFGFLRHSFILSIPNVLNHSNSFDAALRTCQTAIRLTTEPAGNSLLLLRAAFGYAFGRKERTHG